MQIVIVEPDAAKVETLRRRLDAAGLNGIRATVHHGTPTSFMPPQYFAQLVVVSPSAAASLKDETVLRQVYQGVRPYGGVLCLPSADPEFPELVKKTALEQATLRRRKITSSSSAKERCRVRPTGRISMATSATP